MKSFKYTNAISQTVTFDLLTVKGAGHFVPLDRPGPALQMIYNFVNNLPYNTTLSVNVTPAPLNIVVPEIAPRMFL